MNRFLDILSFLGLFLTVFGILFLIQNLTFGQIPGFKDVIVFKVLHLKDLLFTASSLFIISKYVVFEAPKRNS